MMNRELFFYEPFDEDGYLSNFADYPIEVDEQTWKTSEHCYQASKFTDNVIINKIKSASTPAETFLLSRKYNSHTRDDWFDIRYQRMLDIVRAKFSQHTKLAYYLVATENKIIKEHSHKDDYWGDGGDGHGKNCLGKILMQVREELKCTDRFSLLRYAESSILPTLYGEFKMYGFYEPTTGKEHVALTFGRWEKNQPVLLRMHSECLTGDAFSSLRCDCGPQLQVAMKKIADNGSGILIYLRQEGRGIGLLNKIKAYNLQDKGADTVEANVLLGFESDQRQYNFCKGIFEFFSINSVSVMTNNPRKLQALGDIGININKRVPLNDGHNSYNKHYLSTKKNKMGHFLNI
jgi:GTP cyclohydrolase II